MEFLSVLLTIAFVGLLLGAALIFSFWLIVIFLAVAITVSVFMFLRQRWWRWRFVHAGEEKEHTIKIIETEYRDISED